MSIYLKVSALPFRHIFNKVHSRDKHVTKSLDYRIAFEDVCVKRRSLALYKEERFHVAKPVMVMAVCFWVIVIRFFPLSNG